MCPGCLHLGNLPPVLREIWDVMQDEPELLQMKTRFTVWVLGGGLVLVLSW